MDYPIEYNASIAKIEYSDEVVVLYNEAEKYLYSFKWCKNIKKSYLYTNLGSKLCIFLFEIENSASEDDNFLWMIVGDIPPMYLDIFGSKSIREVLNVYVELAKEWTEHIKAGKSTNECYPFNAEPTDEIVKLLGKKIDFLKDVVIENIEDIQLQIL